MRYLNLDPGKFFGPSESTLEGGLTVQGGVLNVLLNPLFEIFGSLTVNPTAEIRVEPGATLLVSPQSG